MALALSEAEVAEAAVHIRKRGAHFRDLREVEEALNDGLDKLVFHHDGIDNMQTVWNSYVINFYRARQIDRWILNIEEALELNYALGFPAYPHTEAKYARSVRFGRYRDSIVEVAEKYYDAAREVVSKLKADESARYEEAVCKRNRASRLVESIMDFWRYHPRD